MARLGCHIGLSVELLNEYRNLRTNSDESELTYQLLTGDISRHLLWYRSIPKTITNHSKFAKELNALKRLIMNGGECADSQIGDDYVRRSLEKRYYITSYHGKVKFPSPVLADAVLHMLYAPNETKIEYIPTDTTFTQFITRAICMMSHRSLANTYSTGVNNQVLERQIQMNFFYSCMYILGYDDTICTDVGQTLDVNSAVDCYVVCTEARYKWAIEIARNGINLRISTFTTIHN